MIENTLVLGMVLTLAYLGVDAAAADLTLALHDAGSQIEYAATG